MGISASLNLQVPFSSMTYRLSFYDCKKVLPMVNTPSNRIPTHPGEMLAKEFLEPMGITQRDLSIGIRVPYQRVNEIVNGRRGITASTALRLAKYFGNSEEFWLYLQLRWDVHQARNAEETSLEEIQPLSA